MDFYKLKVKQQKSNNRESDFVVYPDFIYAGVKDLVCKGNSMYAFWTGTKWSTSLDDLIVTVDNDIRNKVQEVKDKNPGKTVSYKLMNDNETKIMSNFTNYTKMMMQSDVIFNTRIIFSNQTIERDDYATAQLNYYPQEGATKAFDELIGLLYDEKEVEKILWFIGALLTNNMSKIQKFMYLFGGAGSGKGTIIKVIKMIFEGYHSGIDLATLTSGSEFATSQVREVPLLIDEDCDISRISKDVNLLKLTAHEPISVNVKYKDTYDTTFQGLLITASNQRFQVRNVDSGITRRAVVVEPTSYTHKSEVYFNLMDKVKFEVPHIAQKAIDVFNDKGPYYYENYRDVAMAEATDYVFSFVRENAKQLGNEVTLKRAAELFKLYLEDLGYETKGYKRRIKTELQRYYRNFYDKYTIGDERLRNVFVGFKREIVFPDGDDQASSSETFASICQDGSISEGSAGNIEDATREGTSDRGRDRQHRIELGYFPEVFTEYAKTFPAQLTTKEGTPIQSWDKVQTTLQAIDQEKLHFVRVPLNHIVIDFDLKDETGEKNLEMNLEAANKFPETYSEVSKSGKGVHLHYTYAGDVSKLANLYSDGIEIKVFTGKSSLRRKYTKSNNVKIAHISAGLPYKKKDGVKVYENLKEIIWDEKKIRTAVINNLNKKHHNATKPSIDFIDHILKEASESGVKFDVSDLKPSVLSFAMQSTNNSAYCVGKFAKMIFSTIESEDVKEVQSSVGKVIPKEQLYFYDIEVFPNLFIVCASNYAKTDRIKLVNPAPEEIENLMRKPLVGFNNRRYDNHILYGAYVGADNLKLYKQSQNIIDHESKAGYFGNAWELSYADIYEYSDKKQSLKKWEIELGIKHNELGLPWDQPVPEELWDKVAEYCFDDVDATIETFDATEPSYTARVILAELSGLSINATTQQHAEKFLFGDDPKPQEKFIKRDLSKEFPGYTYSYGKSEYMGENPSEGGYVYSEPGVYEGVVTFDVASMHPTSAIVMDYFGPYTQAFDNLVQARLHIKHGEYDKVRKMFNGKLAPYLKDEKTAKQLSHALKIIINIVYGMSSASFDNKFRHPENIDNVIAKRGALFMILLKNEVQKRGFKVVHIKTDSIKVVQPDEEISNFIFEFGKKYGYTFEIEHKYNRFALINKAVLIGEFYDDDEMKYCWDPVGAQFRENYVLKTLFTKEDLTEEDFFITKQVKSAIFLDETFIGKVARVYASKTGYTMTRRDGEKTAAVTGTKGYLWRLDSDFQGHDDIDLDYYEMLLVEAIANIDSVGQASLMIDSDVYSKYVLPF